MKNNIVLIVVLAAIFGIGGGIVGQIVSRVYFFENVFDLPLLGDINIKDSSYTGSSLVISNPKKVVIEQNEKVIETANSVQSSIVGIYKKIDLVTKKDLQENEVFDIDQYYSLKNELGVGFVVTSDGWVISSFQPASLDDENISTSTKKKILNNFVLITKDKKIYEVKDVVVDDYTSYSFWKIDSRDLPVRVFANDNDIKNGQLVMAVNSRGHVWLSTILAKSGQGSLIENSDNFFDEIVLSNSLDASFKNSFLFNLSGDLVALINIDKRIESIGNYTSCINCLLKSNEIKRASMGLNYINLSNLVAVKKNSNYPENGALLHNNNKKIAFQLADSPEAAYLQDNDIILSIDNIRLNKDNSLRNVLSNYIAGEDVVIFYIRDGQEKRMHVVLNELKSDIK